MRLVRHRGRVRLALELVAKGRQLVLCLGPPPARQQRIGPHGEALDGALVLLSCDKDLYLPVDVVSPGELSSVEVEVSVLGSHGDAELAGD